jgi:hypothetical protein
MVITTSSFRLLINDTTAKIPGSIAAMMEVGINSNAIANAARLINKCIFFDSLTMKLVSALNFSADIF